MTEEFLIRLARPQPDPGGGALAAYGGLLALALMEKIVHLEQRRHRENPEMESCWPRLLAEVRTLSGEFSRLLDEDIDAYRNLQKAMKQGNPCGIVEAVDYAVECPMQMMASSTRALPTIIDIGKQCKRHLLADLLVAAELLGATLQGAFHIALVNLPLLSVSSRQGEYRERLSKALKDGLESLDRSRKTLSACHLESLPPDKDQQQTP